MALFQDMTPQDFPLGENTYRYYIQEDSKNPPLILFYGYTGVHKDFLWLAEQLKKDFFIIIPEFPGWNKSPRFNEPLTVRNYAKHFKKLFEHLGIEKLNLFGHCFGAVVAIEYVYLYPETVRELILVSTPYLGGRTERFHKFLVRMAERSPRSIRPVFFFWRSRLLSVPFDFYAIKLRSFEQKLARVKEHIFKQFFEPEDAVEENWISFIKFNFNKVKNIKHQVRLIHGAKDVLVSTTQATKLQKLLPRASLDIIVEAGHVPPVESPEELLALIRKYLKN